MAQLRPPGNANLDGKAAQSDTDAPRVCAVYPCALTPRAEYLALTLCKPSGGVVKYTTPTPPLPPNPYTVPALSTSVIGRCPTLSAASATRAATGLAPRRVASSTDRWAVRGGDAPRRCCCRVQRLLTETPKAESGSWGRGIIMMMMTLTVMATKLPVPVNDNSDELDRVHLHHGLLKGDKQTNNTTHEAPFHAVSR